MQVFRKMVRTYKRNKPQVEKAKLKDAVLSVRRDNVSVRSSAARLHGVNKSFNTNFKRERRCQEYVNHIRANLDADFMNATLKSIQPYPKAPPRKPSTRGRKRRSSEILTSSPVMKRLREEQRASAANKAAKLNKAKRKIVPTTSTKPNSSTSHINKDYIVSA